MNLSIFFTVLALIVSQNLVAAQTTKPTQTTKPIQSSTTTKIPISPVCQAENARNSLIALLSPAGQKTIEEVLMDTQYTAGVVIQPYLNLNMVTYNATIRQVLNSSDASKMLQLLSILCYNNSLCGAGRVKSYCTLQSDVTNLINSFSTPNLPIAVQVTNIYISTVKTYNTTVLNLVNYFDAVQKTNLQATENPSVLSALSAYSYIFNYL